MRKVEERSYTVFAMVFCTLLRGRIAFYSAEVAYKVFLIN